jgi:TetR/AcrR family tetracycline transcriptional repressor
VSLQREAVVRVALALLNEGGLERLTVRRLAERLGVQNPALYWHFKNKQALLDEMARTILADAFAAIEPPANIETWADWLADVAERFHHALLIHRDGARVIATADLAGSALPVIQEMALSALTTAGFDLRTAVTSVVALCDYALGAAFEEQADPDHTTSNRSNVLRSRSLSLDRARLPQLAAALDEITDTATDDSSVGFKGGIRLLLAGMVATKKATGT